MYQQTANLGLRNVYTFCTNLSNHFSIGFVEKPMQGGVRFIGEYYTMTGKLMKILILANEKMTRVLICDTYKRLVFDKEFKSQNLARVTSVPLFISKTLHS